MALVERDAARMVADKEAAVKCMPLAMELLQDEPTLKRLSRNIAVLGIRDAAERVMKQIEKEW
jgi:UDP-N-acetylglucosamine:LPS N-acetylglucosamine transferase